MSVGIGKELQMTPLHPSNKTLSTKIAVKSIPSLVQVNALPLGWADKKIFHSNRFLSFLSLQQEKGEMQVYLLNHNQRDFIFFRHHRYEFKSAEKCRLRELGPRFTLKLRSLQKGTFDSALGEYDWIIQGKRHDMETSRRKFFL